MGLRWYYGLVFSLLAIGCSSTPKGAWSRYSQSSKQVKCMAEAIHGEARGESFDGKVFVGRVILTRVDQGYKGNICSAVYAKRQFAPKKNPKRASYKAARKAFDLGPNGVTHFHSYQKKRLQKAIFSVSDK